MEWESIGCRRWFRQVGGGQVGWQVGWPVSTPHAGPALCEGRVSGRCETSSGHERCAVLSVGASAAAHRSAVAAAVIDIVRHIAAAYGVAVGDGLHPTQLSDSVTVCAIAVLPSSRHHALAVISFVTSPVAAALLITSLLAPLSTLRAVMKRRGSRRLPTATSPSAHPTHLCLLFSAARRTLSSHHRLPHLPVRRRRNASAAHLAHRRPRPAARLRLHQPVFLPDSIAGLRGLCDL